MRAPPTVARLETPDVVPTTHLLLIAVAVAAMRRVPPVEECGTDKAQAHGWPDRPGRVHGGVLERVGEAGPRTGEQCAVRGRGDLSDHALRDRARGRGRELDVPVQVGLVSQQAHPGGDTVDVKLVALASSAPVVGG